MSRRVAIYTRLSKDPDGTQTATARQAEDCHAYAKLRHWDVSEVYEDVDLSAFKKGVERPAYERMLDALRLGEIEGVLVWKLDRLVRRPAEFERFWAVCEEAGADLASVNDTIDTSHASGRAMVRILVTFAGLESETMSLRIKRAKREAALAGRPERGGRRPFGLTDDWTKVIPKEAKLIREAAERVLAGESLRGICLDWNRRGLRAVGGGDWKVASLRVLLLQRRLCGERVVDGQPVKGSWPAILDPSTCTRLAALLNDPARRAPAPVRSYVLTGILKCGKCGAPMRSTQPRDGKRKYACPARPDGCAGTAILAERAEDEVIGQVLVALSDPTLLASLAGDVDDDEVEGEAALAVAEDEAKLLELAEMWDSHRITREEWLSLRSRVESRLDANRQRLTSARRLPQDALAIASATEHWENLDIQRRNAVLRAVLDRVDVMPVGSHRNVWNPERLRVSWRG